MLIADVKLTVEDCQFAANGLGMVFAKRGKMV